MFTLPELGFDYDALEPHIDALTMQIHHSKHHSTYIDNLNKILEGKENLQSKETWDLLSNLEAISEDIRVKVRNNAGGHANHSFFWKLIAPKYTSKTPQGSLLEVFNKNFDSYDEFCTKFKEAALSRFGSGWAWVVVTGPESLEIVTTPNQDTPWIEKKDAILGLDVWEHAYYLKYQNRRAEYVDSFWNILNWDQVNINFEKALSYLHK